MVTTGNENEFIIDLYERLHQTALKMKTNCNDDIMFEKLGVNPQSLFEFKSGIFKGNVDVDLGNLLSSFGVFNNPLKTKKDGGFSMSFQMFESALSMLTNFFGKGVEKILNEPKSTAIAWLIVFIIIESDSDSVKPEDWALLNLLSLIFAFHVSNHLLNDIPSMLLLDLQSLLMKFAVPKKDEEIINPDAKPQGWMNEDSIAVIVVMVSMLVGSSPRPSLEKQVFSFFKNVGQCKGGIVTMFSVVANLFKEFLMKISAPKCFLDFFNCKDVHKSVIEFHDRVTEFCIMCKNQEMNFEDLSMFFLTLRKDFADVSKFVTKDDKESHSYLAEARKRMESEYYGVKTRNDSLRGSRVEPVGIMLSGRPATLKSVLSHHLANALNHATLPEVLLGHFFDNPDMFKYSKGPDKFWDGYAPIANVTIFDDIFQARAVPGGSKEDSEAFNIIKTINTAEYALPIAVAENKGTSFFRSPFCIYTSNMEDVNAQEDIHSKEALRRRFHFWVKVELNEKYRDLLTSEAVLVHFPEDFWILNVTETIGAKLVDHGQIFASDFIKKIVSRAKVHHERFTKSQSKVCGLDIDYNEIRSVYQNQKDHCELIDMESMEKYESDNGDETDTGTIVPQGGEDPKKRKSFWRKIVPKKTKATFRITMDQEKQIPGYFSEKPSLALAKHFDQKNAWNVVTQMVEIATGYEFSREQIISILDVMLNDHSNRLQLQTLRDQGVDRTMIVVQMIQCAVDQRTEENKDVYTGYDLEFWSRQWYNKISECFCDVATIIVVVTTIRVMLRTIRLFLEFVTSYFMPEAVPQSGNEDRYVAPKATKRHGPPRIKVVRSEVKGNTPEGLWDDSYPKNDFNGLGLSRNASNDIVEKILKKNFFIMYYVDENETQPVKKRIGHCVNLTGDFFMMPCHFVNLLYPKLETPGDRDKKEVHFTVANNSRRFKMKLIDFLAGVRENEKLNDKDICLVQTHQEITAKGMFKYLISDKAPVKKRKNFNVSFYTLKQNDNHVTALLTKTTAKLKDEIHITDLWTKSKDNLNYIVEDVLEYPIQTVFGDCGSLIIVDDPNVGHEIVVGMHIAGKKSAGYCNIVTQEDFSDFMEIFGALSFKSEEQFPIVEDLERPVAQSGVFPDAVMHKDFKTPHASRTELTPSKIAGKIRIEGAVKHMPAMLRDFVRDGEVISPLQLALNKYNPDPVAINLHQAYLAGKHYFIKFQSCTRIEREVVPLRNALHHFGEHMNTIDSSSSGGWPFNTKVCDDLKKNYYSAVASGNVELIDMYYNEIDTLVTKAIAMYDRHERPAFVYVDNLKDEIRPVEKVREGKTRLFSGSPFIMLVMFRMYFGAFMDEFVHMNLDVGSAIGINPYGEDWDRLAKKLLFHSNNDVESECIGAGDYSAFDCSQQVEILNVIFHMIQTWYGGSDAHACYIRSMLWAEITSSRHVYDGKLYEWYSSLPSGNPMTAMINTMYNQIAFRYCWIQAGLDISDFNSNVVLIALGDDNIFSVSPWYRAAFNEMTLVHLMKSIGLKYTNETKGESVKPLRRLADVGFLKRGFRFEKEVVRWVGPISTVTISNLLDWTKKIDGDAITVEKAYTALRELSLHGKDVYDRYANQIIDNIQRYVTHIPPVNGWPIRWVDVLEEVCDIDHTVY